MLFHKAFSSVYLMLAICVFLSDQNCLGMGFGRGCILCVCVKTWPACWDSRLDGGRGERERERGDYVNVMKKCRVCRSRVSPFGSPSVAPVSPPLLSLAPPSVPHEWSCFSGTPACLGEAWSPQTQTKHRQKHKTCHVLPAREPGHTKPSLSLLSLFTLCLFLSFIDTQARVQTKSQQSAGHERHNSSFQQYHTCLITLVQSCRKTCGHHLGGFYWARCPVHSKRGVCYSTSSSTTPKFQGADADF